jgi:predicted methyltransferase
MRRKSVLVFALTLAGAQAANAGGEPAMRANIRSAVADPARPAADVSRDAMRKPAQLLAFAGVKPMDAVADFMPGGGYFTRLLSRTVGPKGRVYGFVPDEERKNCPPGETAGGLALAKDPAYPNVHVASAPANDFAEPEQLDMIWTAQNYHDLHDPFMGPADMARVNRRFYEALKSGGVLLIIDHAAAAGSGVRDTNTLHRIDPAAIRSEVEAAGFVFAGESAALRNPADDRTRSVFDPAIRGRTDQVVLKFRKPG